MAKRVYNTSRDTREIRHGKVLEICLNRPTLMNALREQTADEILSALDRAETDNDIRCVVLSGSERAFCTGIDTSEFNLTDRSYFDFFRFRKRQRLVGRLFRELPEFTKPVIAAVDGYALGGGLELALATDMIVANERAQFGLPEVNLGMMPGGAGTQLLPRRIGSALAKELIWTGRHIGAEEALRIGLVNRVAAPGGAVAAAVEIGSVIASKAPLSTMLTKSAIDRGANMSAADGAAYESDLSFLLYFSEDRAEGLQAFKEKRKPEFKGE